MSDINLFPVEDTQTISKNAIMNSNINNTIDNSLNGFHFFNDSEYNTMSSILSPMNMNEMSNIMRANNMSDFLAMTPLHISTSTTTKSPVMNSLMNDDELQYTSYTTPLINKETTVVDNSTLLNLDSVSNSTSNTNNIITGVNSDTNDAQLPVKQQPTDKSKPLEYGSSLSTLEFHPPSLPSIDTYWQPPQPQTSQFMPYGMSMNMNPLVNPYVANEWFRYWPAFAFLQAQQMMQYQQPMNTNGIQTDVKIEQNGENMDENVVHLKPQKSKKKRKYRKRNISTNDNLESVPVKKRKLNENEPFMYAPVPMIQTKEIEIKPEFDQQLKRKRGRPRKYFTKKKKRVKLELPSNEDVLHQNLNLEQLRRYVELVRARQLSYNDEELYVGIKTEDGSVKIRIPKTPSDCGNIPYSVFGTACSARIEDILEAKPRTRYVRGLNEVEKKTRRREQNRTAAARSRARKNAMIAKVIQLHSENMGYRIFVAEKIREIRLLREQVFAHRLQLKKVNEKDGCMDNVVIDSGQRVEVEGSASLGFCRTAKLHCDILENSHSVSIVPPSSVSKISPLFDIISETNPFGHE